MKKLNVGMIGYGFMGRAHSNAFRQVNHFFDLEYQPVLKAVSARNEENLRAFAGAAGWEGYDTDWRRLVERDDIDLIDIAAPNDVHHDIAVAAAEAGKIVLCDQPLARTSQEARDMVAAVKKAGVPNLVWYN
jgi:predicted dehydrogenase